MVFCAENNMEEGRESGRGYRRLFSAQTDAAAADGARTLDSRQGWRTGKPATRGSLFSTKNRSIVNETE